MENDLNSVAFWLALISSMSGLLLAMITAVALGVQWRLTQYMLGIQLLSTYEDKFTNDQHLLHLREATAKALLHSKDRGKVTEADEIMNFFEAIGLLLQRRILDPEMVWNSFAYWVNGYWYACNPRLVEYRQETRSPYYWANFEFLFKKLSAVEKRRSGLPEYPPSEDKLHQFLTWETTASKLR